MAHVVAVDPGGGAGTRANPLPPNVTSLPADRQVLGPSNQDPRSQLIDYREADAQSIDDFVAAAMRPMLEWRDIRFGFWNRVGAPLTATVTPQPVGREAPTSMVLAMQGDGPELCIPNESAYVLRR